MSKQRRLSQDANAACKCFWQNGQIQKANLRQALKAASRVESFPSGYHGRSHSWSTFSVPFASFYIGKHMEKCPICHTEHFPSSWLSRYNTNCPVMDLGQRGGHARPIHFSISSVPSALCRSDCMKCAHRETCFADLCVFVFITNGAYTYCVYLNVYVYIYTLFQKYLCARKHTAHARVD